MMRMEDIFFVAVHFRIDRQDNTMNIISGVCAGASRGGVIRLSACAGRDPAAQSPRLAISIVLWLVRSRLKFYPELYIMGRKSVINANFSCILLLWPNRVGGVSALLFCFFCEYCHIVIFMQ